MCGVNGCIGMLEIIMTHVGLGGGGGGIPCKGGVVYRNEMAIGFYYI